MKSLDKALLAADIIMERKAIDPVLFNVGGMSSFTDYFIIMQGNSKRQNAAIYESVERELKTENVRPLSIEGRKNADWILMDYGGFIVHIFSIEAREYYLLEKLWGDAPRLEY